MNGAVAQGIMNWLHENLPNYDVREDETITGSLGQIELLISTVESTDKGLDDEYFVIILAGTNGRIPIDFSQHLHEHTVEVFEKIPAEWDIRFVPLDEDFGQVEYAIVGRFFNLSPQLMMGKLAEASLLCTEVNLHLSYRQRISIDHTPPEDHTGF